MKCKYCGHDNEEDSKFCINCGQIFGKMGDEKNIEDILFVPQKTKTHILRNVLLVLGVVGVLSILVFFFADSSSTPPANTTGATNNTDSVPNGWQTFNSVEQGFSINFPTYPSTDRIPEDKINEYAYSGIQYTSAPDNDTVYMAQVGDYDIPPKDYDNKAGLEGIVNGMINEVGGKLNSSSFIKFNGYDAVNFIFTSKDGYFGNGLAFIRDDLGKIKAYILMKFSANNDKTNFDSFINSFKIN